MIDLQWSARFLTIAIVSMSLSADAVGQPPARGRSRAQKPRVNVVIDPLLPGYPIPGHDVPVGPSSNVIRSRGSHRVVVNDIPPILERDAFSVAVLRRRAEVAFFAAQYGQSLRMLRHALIEAPADGELHLLLSHAQSAMGDYPTAARSLQQAIALLDRRDWRVLLGNDATYFPRGEHARILGGLYDHIERNPATAAKYLLRGYHRMLAADRSGARQDLLIAASLDKDLKLPAQFLQMVAVPAAPEDIPTPVPAQ